MTTSAEAVRRVLANAPGDGVCDACLARVCGASESEIHEITEQLLEDNRCGRGTVCVHCGRDVNACLVIVADTTTPPPRDGLRRARKLTGRPPRRTAARGLVVVVDDDISVRRGLSRLLEAAGYRVSACGSGRELLERLVDETPSCLVLDVRMPGLSGIAVHEALRAAGQRIPVVFITGDVEIPSTTRATTGASVAILAKPVDEDELFATVHRLIAASRDPSDVSVPPEH